MKKESQKWPENLRQGAWESEPGKVLFALWAPGKKTISVVGDFNDWDKDAHPMTEDDGMWWVETELDDGDHEYMYVIDDNVYICDPYAREVNWTSEGAHAILRTGKKDFEWGDDMYLTWYSDDILWVGSGYGHPESIYF